MSVILSRPQYCANTQHAQSTVLVDPVRHFKWYSKVWWHYHLFTCLDWVSMTGMAVSWNPFHKEYELMTGKMWKLSFLSQAVSMIAMILSDQEFAHVTKCTKLCPDLIIIFQTRATRSPFVQHVPGHRYMAQIAPWQAHVLSKLFNDVTKEGYMTNDCIVVPSGHVMIYTTVTHGHFMIYIALSVFQ